MNNIEPAILMRRAGGIKRYHNRPIIGEQTVAAHTWGVIVLLFEMCCPSVSLLYAATFHDAAEVRTGDCPADAKERWPKLRDILNEAEEAVADELCIAKSQLTPDEKFALKAADLLELLWFCYEQRRLGNLGLDEVWTIGNDILGILLFNRTGSDGIPDALTLKVHGMREDVETAREQLFDSEPSHR